MPTTEVRDRLQATLGDAYQIERELTPGGMSRLYLARERSLDRQVVIKLLPPEYASEVSAARFQREVTLTAHLQHPHILPILATGSRDGLLYYVMPYVDGESLRQRLERDGKLPVPLAIQILRDVADALARAHKAGVVHRDIKPENILLQDDRAILADFGVAGALHETTSADRLTEAGTGLGTPGYMAPEQLAGERHVDARADVYALAVVGYEMVAGVAPFTGATPQAVAAAHFTTAPRPLASLRSGVPPAVSTAITKALAKEPDQRFASAAEFRDALVAGGAAFAGVPRSVVSGAAAGLVIAVLAAGAVVWRARASHVEGPPLLAVLPFDNEGDSANEYFADGITDEIRGKLSALPDLRVIATTSSNQYRHTHKSPQQISRELGVQYLLTGSVAWAQGANGTRRVRVSPELVRVGDRGPPETRWHQSFDTTLADVFDVQASVATRVADRLGVVLSPPAQAQLAARPTQNLAAYDAYLRSTALPGIDPATVRRQITMAEQAVALDSTFAVAWARVGYLHAVIYGIAVPTFEDSMKARRAIERAMALAPQAEEGYEAWGLYNFVVEHDTVATLAAYRKAVLLAPSSAAALNSLAMAEAGSATTRVPRGQEDSVLALFRRASVLDPRSTFVASALGQYLMTQHRYAEARIETRRSLAIAGTALNDIELLAETYLGEGDLRGAQAVLRDVPPTLDRRALVAFVANYKDLYWILDSADRALVLSLPASAFDNDTATWAVVHAQLYWIAGDVAPARAWADSARRLFAQQLTTQTDDWQRHLFHALALAYLGQRQLAIPETERVCAAPPSAAYCHHMAARIYLALGDSGHALDEIERFLALPYEVSPAWVRIDPDFAPLHGNERFARLTSNTPP